MKRLVAAGVAALLGGCAAVGPDYQRPALEAPAQWSETREKAQAYPALEETAWWKTLDDPVLDSLIEQAVQGNLDLQQARARIVQARSALVVAGAPGQPLVGATGSVIRSQGSRNGNLSVSSLSPNTLYQAGFDASWELDVFGGIRRGVEAAQARLDSSVEDLRATLVTLLGDVARNYVNLRANQEQLEITLRNVEAQQQTVEVTRERNRLGLTSYLDVAQAEAQKSSTEANIPTLEAAIKQSAHRLGILLGREPNALKAELWPPRPLPRAGGVIAAGLPSQLLARRPDLRRAERQLAAASADIGVATANLYPRFDLVLAFGLQSASASKLIDAASQFWSLGPLASVVLLDGGRTRANIEGAQAAYDESLARYRSDFISALEEVENALAGYQAEQTRHQILVAAVGSSEEAVALANERYRRGLSSFLDVLTAENSLYAAQRSLSQSEANLVTDLVTLYKALGGGWSAEDIRLAGAASLAEQAVSPGTR